ncbi:heavy metal translocating P-type ATPase [Porphyromonadaceae bacterium W3.11]|nr:heavy metal translocating P-type ATPase [Porphyromonadaceae bacterium W3.11]
MKECSHKGCACNNSPNNFCKTHDHHDKSEDTQPHEVHSHSHEHTHGVDDGEHKHRILYSVFASVLLLLTLIGIEYWAPSLLATEWVKFVAYFISFLPVGIPVFREGIEIYQAEKTFFNECTLMVMASIGAFIIGEYPEAVVLMILYNVGEWLQGLAVNNARRSISDLVDSRTEKVMLIKDDGSTQEVNAEEAHPGDIIRMNTGMRLSLDGVLLSKDGLLDVSALTGESIPKEVSSGDEVLAGSVVMSKPLEMKVSKEYRDSTLARILEMAEAAAERKPTTEKFIRRFAKIYTPIVTGLAALVVVLPWVWSLIHPSFIYLFDDWLYRGLVFLVTSCPCALIISVPLTYFCGIGSASRRGVLFKGAVFLERLKKITAVVFDKTGTLTEGKFEIKEILHSADISEEEAIALISAVEAQSTHPMAIAITNYASERNIASAIISEVHEQTGMGLNALTNDGSELLVGSERLMAQAGVNIPDQLHPKGASAVLLAKNNKVIATVILQDSIKNESQATIKGLRKRGISKILMLSGDKQDVVTSIGLQLGIDEVYGDLLPDNKMERVDKLMKTHSVLFVGDGLNDAPVMNLADLGAAMGGIGSDATIEAADMVIQGDSPYKVVESMDIAHRTERIVRQNIIFSLGFKFLVMFLATIGIASLTLAIIADVGVTLLVIANALRALRLPEKKR